MLLVEIGTGTGLPEVRVVDGEVGVAIGTVRADVFPAFAGELVERRVGDGGGRPEVVDFVFEGEGRLLLAPVDFKLSWLALAESLPLSRLRVDSTALSPLPALLVSLMRLPDSE